MASTCRTIEIEFPETVELPAGFERALDGLLTMACREWERTHPGFVMWPAGSGSKPIWNEPHEPTFDDSVWHIEVASRKATEREIERGRVTAAPSEAPKP